MTNGSADGGGDPEPNIVKCRDDIDPVLLVRASGWTSGAPIFRVKGGSGCSWAKAEDVVDPGKLRARIEPWLTALCQSEHFSLLVGSGLSSAVHRLATGKAIPGMLPEDFGEFQAVVSAAAKKSAAAAGRGGGNIEDQLRVVSELLRGLEIQGELSPDAKNKAAGLEARLRTVLDEFAAKLLGGEQAVLSAPEKAREEAFNYLVSFLMSFASRSGTRDRLHVFTTNYDRFIEAGAETAGMHLLDRFVGSLAPVFRSSRLDLDMHYNPPGIRGEPRYLEGVARFTKLHGSLDWMDRSRHIHRMTVPFGAKAIGPYMNVAGDADEDSTRLMIYPNAAKDRETAGHPYVELFRDFAAAACRPNHTLVAFGFSFGDEHINRVVEDMLTIPSTHLVVLAYNDPLGQIMKMYSRVGRPAQITLLVGDHVGAFQSLVDHYLPKPAIDRTTFRMAELLKSRFGTWQSGNDSKTEQGTSTTTGEL